MTAAGSFDVYDNLHAPAHHLLLARHEAAVDHHHAAQQRWRLPEGPYPP